LRDSGIAKQKNCRDLDFETRSADGRRREDFQPADRFRDSTNVSILLSSRPGLGFGLQARLTLRADGSGDGAE